MKTKKLSSKDSLLLFLHNNGNGTYHCKELRDFVGVKYRQFLYILKQLKLEGLLTISPSTTDKRMRTFVLKENAMARLKKRNLITPSSSVLPFSRESLTEGIKRRHQALCKAPKPNKKSIMIPAPVFEILEHWNKQPHVVKMKLPEKTFVKSFYNNPTKHICQVVSILRKAIAGKSFLYTPIQGLIEKIRPFSKQEIKDAITNFSIASTSQKHEPRNKTYFQNKCPISHFLYNPFSKSSSLKFHSLFLHYVDNPPKLLQEYVYLDKIKGNVEREWLDYITEELIQRFTTRFDFQENIQVLEAIAIKLYDFAEAHGGIYVSLANGLETWPIWLVNALSWKKENAKFYNRTYRINLMSMLQDDFYKNVLIPYIKYIQADHTIDLEEKKKDDEDAEF